ncbi:Aldo/keto reductase [Ceraceosorus guamensis]|uniref:Aldo/keto reductase n=1 Tax=Ceraceosorus guamensis TaxID=1522189 RepID=A0A316WAC2_9BASI|nr:Aldo/keto reductase [Ceraceosorus guamensis]PWN45681.1 Aldo/keto reductase [Ceraceosorus guamensis]
MSSQTRVKVVFGAMTFGAAGQEQARVHGLQDQQAILDVFAKHGHKEVDTARVYGNGTSEENLGRLKASSHFQIATKNFPSRRRPLHKDGAAYDHTAPEVHRCLADSLKALQTDCVDLYYLHSPDRDVPFAETLGALNEEYKAGKFKRLGISNYTAQEVEEIIAICEKNGFVKPSVYQGIYNSVVRSPEQPLFPVLRKHGIAFYAFNPLGGGLYTGNLKWEDSDDKESQEHKIEKGSRFDANTKQGEMYRKRYFKKPFFDALEVLRPAADKHNFSLAEVALRWMQHHSKLTPDHGDAIIIGASSLKHIEQNLLDFEKGPLPQDVLDAVEKANQLVSEVTPPYHH